MVRPSGKVRQLSSNVLRIGVRGSIWALQYSGLATERGGHCARYASEKVAAVGRDAGAEGRSWNNSAIGLPQTGSCDVWLDECKVRATCCMGRRGKSGEQLAGGVVETALISGLNAGPCLSVTRLQGSDALRPGCFSEPELGKAGQLYVCSTKNFVRLLPTRQIAITMAKSAHNRSKNADTNNNASKSIISADKNAFDPTLASLFASSVRIRKLRQLPPSCQWQPDH